MSATIWLKAAAGLALIQYIAHALLFFRAKPSHGQEEIDVVNTMKSHRWKFSGLERSYWDFYFGYGLLAILWGVVEIFLLWQVASIAAASSVSIIPFLVLLLIANIGHAILTMLYFFPLPAVFDLLIALVLFLTMLIK
jgi:hypothetical protein